MLPVALALLSAAIAAGVPPCGSTRECLAAIEAAQSGTRTISARFVQVKHVSLLDEPLTSRGRFFFRRPDRIRLEIEEPVRTAIVIDGAEIHIPDLPESERKAMSMAPMAAMFTQLGALFTGSTAALEDGFEVKATGAGDGIDVVLLPRLESWRRLFRRIELRFAGAPLMTREVRLEDAFGDRLEVKMEDVERNPDLPETLFAAPEKGA